MKMEERDIRTDEFNIKRYYKKGTDIIHREDGHAVEYISGRKDWYINGEPHRIDGPAVEWANGGQEWWIDGKLNRIDGPAISYPNGYKVWYINGKPHRDDGPAVEWDEEGNEWWINGVRLSPEKEAIMNSWWENKNGRT